MLISNSYIFHFNTLHVNIISVWPLNWPWALEFEHHWGTGARVVRGAKCSVYRMSFGKGKFSSFKNDKKDLKKKDVRESSPPQGIVCYECNGHGHLKKECLNYLRGKGKVLITTLCDLESSNSNSKEGCDGDGNYSAFMAITLVDSKDELSELVEEVNVHFDVEEVEVSNDEEMYLNEGGKKLQDVYEALLGIVARMLKLLRVRSRK